MPECVVRLYPWWFRPIRRRRQRRHAGLIWGVAREGQMRRWGLL